MAPNGAFRSVWAMSHHSIAYYYMRFKIPGQDVSVRLFERVSTTDSQYDIFDVGLEQADGSIDSMVVGGSFSYAKSRVSAMDKKAEEKKSTATVTVLTTEEAAA